MAAGELSSANDKSRFEVRKTLVELDYVDCVVQLSGQLFANTQVPCSLWFVSKNRAGRAGSRNRRGEVLFIDGRKLGTLIPGSRKQKSLSALEVEEMAHVFRVFKTEQSPKAVTGFFRVATVSEVREKQYGLTPGRYVGNSDTEDWDEPFETRFPKLVADLGEHLTSSSDLAATVLRQLHRIGDGT